ncbi:MAG: ribosomal-protein-alanine N-acetyltransferase, partial [Pseudoxanthomonas sp.]
MSAVAVDSLSANASLRSMRESDLDVVMAIEVRAYPFPWTRGILRDCLAAGYPAWILQEHGLPIGYAVISVAADEA